MLSHDLRGPLASFATTMMMLDENVITMDEFRMLKPEINNQLVSLNLLLDEFIETGQKQYDRRDGRQARNYKHIQYNYTKYKLATRKQQTVKQIT